MRAWLEEWGWRECTPGGPRRRRRRHRGTGRRRGCAPQSPPSANGEAMADCSASLSRSPLISTRRIQIVMSLELTRRKAVNMRCYVTSGQLVHGPRFICVHTQTSFIIISKKGRLPASGLSAKRPGHWRALRLYNHADSIAAERSGNLSRFPNKKNSLALHDHLKNSSGT